MSHPVLTQEQLQTLLKQFLEERGAEFDLSALGYFGSYARKEAKPDSDVDIVFDTSRPNLFTTLRLQSALCQCLNRSVDLVRLHEYLPPNFKERLRQQAIYI
jgi:predicted nucleotidyltransferase